MYACQFFVFLRELYFSVIFDFHFRENPRLHDKFQALKEISYGVQPDFKTTAVRKPVMRQASTVPSHL